MSLLCVPQTSVRLEACRAARGASLEWSTEPACRADEGRPAARSMLLQALMFMESYMERVKEEEKANGVRPPPSSTAPHCPRARDCTALEHRTAVPSSAGPLCPRARDRTALGHGTAQQRARRHGEHARAAQDEEGFLEELPPVPWRDLPRRARAALASFGREVATATTRRALEHRAAARLAPRLAWKLLKGARLPCTAGAARGCALGGARLAVMDAYARGRAAKLASYVDLCRHDVPRTCKQTSCQRRWQATSRLLRHRLPRVHLARASAGGSKRRRLTQHACCADVKESSLRKARRLPRPQRVLRGCVSTYRAMALSYTADFLVASAIDAYRHARPAASALPAARALRRS